MYFGYTIALLLISIVLFTGSGLYTHYLVDTNNALHSHVSSLLAAFGGLALGTGLTILYDKPKTE